MTRIDASAPSPFLTRATAWVRWTKDLLITLLLWVYFTAGFVIFFAPFYVLSLVFARYRASAFQCLNYLFYKVFFILCRLIIPSHRWNIDPRVSGIRSAVVICNHVSYLDSILLVSLFPKHTTIAKDKLFGIPILGHLMALSGYIPSSGKGRFADLLLNSLTAVTTNLQSGANIIVFPEGTRSRNGQVGTLNRGAFKIAKYCRAPIKVLKIRNTDKLFIPGKFLFNTCSGNMIELKLIAELTPDYDSSTFSIPGLMAEVHALLGDHGKQPDDFLNMN